MSISTRIIRYVSLALAVGAVAAPGAQASSGSGSPGAALSEAHWQHEDRMYEVNRAPASLEAHWNHEDAQYSARTQSAALAVESGEGIGLSRALMTAGGMVALLVLGTVAVTGVRRKRSGVAPGDNLGDGLGDQAGG